MESFHTERMVWNFFFTVSSLFDIFCPLFVRPIFLQFYNFYGTLFIEFDENAHRDTAEKA